MTDLDTIQRILAYIRQAKVDQFNALQEFDGSDLARAVPECPEHVRRELSERKQ